MSAKGEGGQASAEDVVVGAGAALSLCFGVGLLATAQSLPVRWQPGQVIVLAVLLAIVPASVVLTTRQLAGLVGIRAADYARRAAIARWAAVGALAVALPIYQAGMRSASGGASGALPSVAIGVVLCWLAMAMAAHLARAWSLLQVQPWEVAQPRGAAETWVSVETAGRVDRERVVRDLWRNWLGGGVALALALLLEDQLATAGHQAASDVGLAAFVLYCILGLVLLGQAARARQVVYWRLANLATPADLERTWAATSVRAALLALASIALLLAVRVLDALHTVVQWGIALLALLLGPLGRWLQRPVDRTTGTCGAPGSCGGNPVRRIPPSVPRAPAHVHTPGLPDWLAHDALILLAIVALAILAHAYHDARKMGAGRSGWREMLAILMRDFRLLLGYLWRPAQRALREVATIRETGLRARRGARRRGDHIDWSDPRRAIIGIYLATTALAARRGFPRRAGQTPDEYARELAGRLPATGEAIQEMTETFAAARYGPAPVDRRAVGRMQAAMAALRALLKKNH